MSYTLRPYQEEAVQATLGHFRQERSPAVVVLPTGAGKSLVIAELAKIAKGRVLVLAHVKELVEQNCQKYMSYGLPAGVYSAGLNRKDMSEKVIFGSIQSVARAHSSFFEDFSLLVIDECHRVSNEAETQYAQVIEKLREAKPDICLLGLTATPYRLGSGWLYQYNHRGVLYSEEERLFEKCIYDLNLESMIENGYLTPPVQIDAPVASYDFSSLNLTPNKTYKMSDIEDILKDQKRFTPGIIQNIIEMSEDRQGVMIFTSTVRHAEEVLSLLPEEQATLIVGDTPSQERDEKIERFKEKKIKYLVNVSVLTTGFDAPHVDLIAILRPTESVSLFQQIVGRGLRLSAGKEDCLVLDYTGVKHDIFSPEILEDKPVKEAVAVKVSCPMCDHENDFWGLKDEEGSVVEHFGKKCRGAIQDPSTLKIVPCGFRYRFKSCDKCGAENDANARVCLSCRHTLVDDSAKLAEARSAKNMHVMRPDSMTFEKKTDKRGLERLEVKYYDLDAQHLSEIFYINNESDSKVFYYNFMRMHLRLPGKKKLVASVDDAIDLEKQFRLPVFVIASKEKKYWKIREKIFT